MRISPSDIRKAISDPNFRITTERTGVPISTDGTIRKAIRLFHTAGVEAASAALEGGLKSGYWRDRGISRAKNARQLLDTYIDLARADGRPASPVGSCDISALGHTINADLDLILHDAVTVTGRLCIYANVGPGLPFERCALIAAAPFRGLCEEFEKEDSLFGETVKGIEVWQLRCGQCVTVSRDAAAAAWPSLLSHLTRAVSE
jgi:hypothetical protein